LDCCAEHVGIARGLAGEDGAWTHGLGQPCDWRRGWRLGRCERFPGAGSSLHENGTPSLSPALHDIHVNMVSAEEASFGVAEFWSGDRLIGFTFIPDTNSTRSR
jgi:hypothetical protein